MRIKKQYLMIKVLFILSFIIYLSMTFMTKKVHAMDNGSVVVVIDPGHGGTDRENQFGACVDDLIEKNLNMIVANAVLQRLSQYDGIKVYLTHDSTEIPMSLRKRAEFASSVQADLLVSIHFNASISHITYGSEVWIPSIGTYYKAGYQIGKILTDNFQDMGLVNRGIKTRLGSNGDEYYGIIRESEHLSIPAIIVEHCYLDSMNDRDYVDSEADLELFGKTDADSIAAYFGLKSTALGCDYSNYQCVDVGIAQTRIGDDVTPPQFCNIEYTGKKDRIKSTVQIQTKDDESDIVYYAYSTDGGVTFSNLYPYEQISKDGGISQAEITINHETEEDLSVIVRVYNQYDLCTDSNTIVVPKPEDEDTSETIKTSDYKGIQQNYFIIFISIIVLVCMIFISNKVIKKKIYKKK